MYKRIKSYYLEYITENTFSPIVRKFSINKLIGYVIGYTCRSFECEVTIYGRDYLVVIYNLHCTYSKWFAIVSLDIYINNTLARIICGIDIYRYQLYMLRCRISLSVGRYNIFPRGIYSYSFSLLVVHNYSSHLLLHLA